MTATETGFEILAVKEMREADRLAVQSHKISSRRLIENAGRAVANEIIRRFKKCAVAVICGPGNNGGDGFVVARILTAQKWPVTLFLTVAPTSLLGDAAHMCKLWKKPVHEFATFGTSFEKKASPKLIVDAIFGTGLNREFPQSWAAAIAAAKVPVVAVDVPSGLDGDTGRAIGSCIKADVTVTFFRKKPVHVLQPGRSLCGEIIVADIAIPANVLETIKPQLWENSSPQLPIIATSAYKFSRGHAVVWSGPELATGASRLAALAAARAGAGVVSLVGYSDALRAQAAHVTSIMLKPVDGESDFIQLLSDKRITALCIGPAAGVSEKMRRMVLVALRSGAACVLDADALMSFEEAPADLFTAIKELPNRPVIMTPHEGEFNRLFKSLADSIESKVEVARRASSVSGAVVVFKGPDTVIAAPDGAAKINSNAPAKLATAGSGDVLAGIITGLLAQGMAGFDAASAGVWLHGDAAGRVDRRNIIAEDLIAEIGR
ncbi:MAG: NAD(P)H-hydrate dehydratase [Pseudomonadota bacterium]|nr:NAD(P)H-hydrate dehydratase [Pseudomonadota bacterium]